MINYFEAQRYLLITFSHQPYPLTGEQIYFIRNYFEMTGQQFSEKFGVSQECVSKWENYKNKITKMLPTTEFCIRLFIMERILGRESANELEKMVKSFLGEGNLKNKIHPVDFSPDPFEVPVEVRCCMNQN